MDTVMKLLDEIEEVLDQSRAVPFSSKVNVDKEELIKLLKRDRPMRYKKVTLRGGIMVEHVTECPACHKEILCKRYDYPRFCTHCGQAIEKGV